MHSSPSRANSPRNVGIFQGEGQLQGGSSLQISALLTRAKVAILRMGANLSAWGNLEEEVTSHCSKVKCIPSPFGPPFTYRSICVHLQRSFIRLANFSNATLPMCRNPGRGQPRWLSRRRPIPAALMHRFRPPPLPFNAPLDLWLMPPSIDELPCCH
jgi:hypothetical protein